MVDKVISQPDAGDKIITEEGVPLDNLQLFLDDFVRQFNLLESVQSINANGVIDIVSPTTEITTSTSQVDLTLADGNPGQTKKIIMIVDGGFDAVITVASLFGGNTLTFANAGSEITLLFTNVLGWFPEVNNGVVIA